jgi:hypothetical protein
VPRQGFDYPGLDLSLDQYCVIIPDDSMTVYRNWFRDFSLGTITALLDTSGFAITEAWSHQCGTPYAPESPRIGLAAIQR